MPRRNDLKRVMILGSGPIVIGQACEFDYSGTQACKALMQDGFEVILVNSNPATIMTDPEVATRVYVEPLRADFIERILEKERPDALIPTLGGQTALNLALELHGSGVLARLGVELLGATPKVIRAAEDREQFRSILDQVGARYPKSELVRSLEQGKLAAQKLGYPLVLRPNYTLGGGGGGIAFHPEDYHVMLTKALLESPTSEVLVEESILGWKEFELEVMRDADDSFVVVCSIENIDPCGVHTGDSITVAPQQTLSDREYQSMRDEAGKIIRAVGVQTGGANIQFAVHPHTRERVVIEMNPRVSRSSALASKATGFPIAKIAALLAVGYRLHELRNDITKSTPCSYEPALDYVVTKIPRFAFEKFPGTPDRLTTQMKSVGEVMAIGRTFSESFMKAVLSLEADEQGFPEILAWDEAQIATANSQRIFHLWQALRSGVTVEKIHQLSGITPYFLEKFSDCVSLESELRQFGESNLNSPSSSQLPAELLIRAKRNGFSDAAVAKMVGSTTEKIRSLRRTYGLHPAYLQVDTCAGEFASETPYFYSTYWSQQSDVSQFRNPVVVLGSGPNRIGQGIEFDYGCVRAVKALRAHGEQVVMMNSNPETVSTDYDTADILFFEPLTVEHVGEVLRHVGARAFLSQLGGQTPIHLAGPLVKQGYAMAGSSLKAMDLAEDRSLFSKLCQEIGLAIPRSAMVYDLNSARAAAKEMSFPLICRPSYVLGGRRMEIVERDEDLVSYFARNGSFFTQDKPCLMDQFLEGALEIDVDLVRGVDWCVVGGVLEHIEAAGVHSGDSMGVLPPQRLREDTLAEIEKMAVRLANRLEIVGHLNLQLAVLHNQIFILEANPRSSRSVPFIAKATHIPLVDLGVKAVLGKTKQEVQPLRYQWRQVDRVCVKGVVFPFRKFQQADSILGPEMKSTGESMGIGSDYADALMKGFIGSGYRLPTSGEVFLSLRDQDKAKSVEFARELHELGFRLSATTGTAEFLMECGLPVVSLKKVHEGSPNCVDRIRQGEVVLVINTARGRKAIEASFEIRRACIDLSIPCLTETDAATAFLLAMKGLRAGKQEVEALASMQL